MRKKSMVFVYTAMGVLSVEHANVLELCYIELLSGDGSPYSILSAISTIPIWMCVTFSRIFLFVFTKASSDEKMHRVS